MNIPRKSVPSITTNPSNRIRLAWLAIAIGVILAAWTSLHRLQDARLFLFSLPFDRPPSDLEIRDAVAAARKWTSPALLFLVVASLSIVLTVRTGPIDTMRAIQRRLRELIHVRRVLCVLFALACLADFLSTMWYFQSYSLEDELHPGIKLVTYAWGLSVGCLAAKGIQASLLLLVCALYLKIARPLLIVTTIGYAAAAVWNLGIF